MEKPKNDKIGIALAFLMTAGLVSTLSIILFTDCQLQIKAIPTDCEDYTLYIRLLYSTVVVAGVLIIYGTFKNYKK